MDDLDRWVQEGYELTDPADPARTAAILSHLSGFAAYIFPFGGIIAALVVWLVKRDSHPFADRQGKEALNFQISISIYTIVSAILIIVGVGIVLLPLVFLFHVVLMIMAAIQASNGKGFEYPGTLRLVK
ncbi:MAG: DUF4870 domain-containing protein [Gemmatimonadales bacterium]|nr:MAG: DUF4870 domain-containing protein [Gemmatimonadales bacterium]